MCFSGRHCMWIYIHPLLDIFLINLEVLLLWYIESFKLLFLIVSGWCLRKQLIFFCVLILYPATWWTLVFVINMTVYSVECFHVTISTVNIDRPFFLSLPLLQLLFLCVHVRGSVCVLSHPILPPVQYWIEALPFLAKMELQELDLPSYLKHLKELLKKPVKQRFSRYWVLGKDSQWILKTGGKMRWALVLPQLPTQRKFPAQGGWPQAEGGPPEVRRQVWGSRQAKMARVHKTKYQGGKNYSERELFRDLQKVPVD